MALLISLLTLFNLAHAQDYGEYNEYQVFTNGENTSRHWGFTFAPSGMYFNDNEDNQVEGANPTDRQVHVSLFDLKLGHVFRQGLYFGAIYAIELQDTGSPRKERTSFGITFGFLYKGWTFLGHYFPYSIQKVTSTTATFNEFAKGAGYQFEVGYHLQVSKYISVGPMIAYKSFLYGEAQNATTLVDSSASSVHNIVTPMLSFLFLLYR